MTRPARLPRLNDAALIDSLIRAVLAENCTNDEVGFNAALHAATTTLARLVATAEGFDPTARARVAESILKACTPAQAA